MPTVLIAPVGLYVGRVLTSIRTCTPQKIYLMVATKNHGWAEKTEENVKKLLEDLLGFYGKDRIRVKRAHFGSFVDVFEKVDRIIVTEKRRYQEKGEQVRFWMDITSAPMLPRMAMVSIAALYPEAHVYYTPSREPKDPLKHYGQLAVLEKDLGKEPQEIPIVRSKAYVEIERKRYFRSTLVCLFGQRSRSVRSQSELMGLVKLDPSSSKDYMMIGRVLSELEDLGLISTTRTERAREKKIGLTLLGIAVARTLSKSKP